MTARFILDRGQAEVNEAIRVTQSEAEYFRVLLRVTGCCRGDCTVITQTLWRRRLKPTLLRGNKLAPDVLALQYFVTGRLGAA